MEPSVWLDAGSLFLTDGAAVSDWPDRSGNFRNATQAAALRRPVFYDDVANGFPVVRFNLQLQEGGIANQFMAFSSALGNDTPLVSLYVVAFDSGTRSTATSRATVVNTRTNGTVANGFLFGYSTTPFRADYAHVGRSITEGGSGTLQFADIGESDFNLLTVRRNDLTSTLGAFTDVDASSSTVTWSGYTPSTLTTTQIGTEGGQHYFFGDIAEIIAFEGVELTDEEHNQIVKYLGDKYDITFASAVPEPSAILLISAAGLGLIFRRRTR